MAELRFDSFGHYTEFEPSPRHKHKLFLCLIPGAHSVPPPLQCGGTEEVGMQLDPSGCCGLQPYLKALRQLSLLC